MRATPTPAMARLMRQQHAERKCLSAKQGTESVRLFHKQIIERKRQTLTTQER